MVISLSLLVTNILHPPPPVQARPKSEKQRSDGLVCLDKTPTRQRRRNGVM